MRRLDIANLRVLENEFEVTSPIKDLGIVFDCSLSFNEQINRVVKTAGYHLRNISFLKNLFRKTAQYFLDTLHIREAAITP